jgi:lantibiotic modifying enzyme
LVYDEDSKRLEFLVDEILYGSAGYLYCLLTLRSRIGIRYHQKID